MATGESRRGQWKIYTQTPPANNPPADPNGTYYGVTFTGGMAYVKWQTLGEAATEVVIQNFGHDPRFKVIEIPEKDYPLGTK